MGECWVLQILLYAKDSNDLAELKNLVDDMFIDVNSSSECCDYPMDILDFLNNSSPEQCTIFFDTDSISQGLEIARKVHEIDPRYRFNLFCNESCDPEEMYHMGVTYFVSKPYQYLNMEHCLESVLDFFDNVHGRIISLKKKNGTDILRLSEIKYIMSDKRKVVFVCENGQTDYYYKLDEVEEMLDGTFLRCHQSYIVNMKRIKLFVEEGLLLWDETFIPISRKKYFAAKRKYMSYLSGDKLLEM